MSVTSPSTVRSVFSIDPRRWAAFGARHVWSALGVVLLIAYALFLRATWYPVIVGADDHGYYAQGALLVNDGHMWFTLESPVQYVGRHWLRDETAHYVSRYSPGLGMLVAGVTWLGGAEASVVINPLLSIVALLGVWMLIATRLGMGWGVAGMLVLVFSPAFVGQAMLGGSHIVVLTLLVWGTHLLLAWRERDGTLRGLAAGLLFGFIPVVRPSEAMLALGVGALLLYALWSGRRAWREAVPMVVGAVVAASPLLLYNRQTFGSISRTAYAITDEQTAFALSNVRDNVVFYGRGMLEYGLGLFTVMTLGGIAYLLVAREGTHAAQARDDRVRGARLHAALLALLSVPVVALYLAFFYVPHNEPALGVRFLVPLFPLFLFASLLLVSRWTGTMPPVRRAAIVGVLLMAHSVWGARGLDAMTRNVVAQKARASAVVDAVKRSVPDGSVVFSTDELFAINLDLHQRWHVADRLLSLDRRVNAVLDGMRRDEDRLAKQRGKRSPQLARFAGLSARARDSVFAEETGRWGTGAVYYVGPSAIFDRPTSPLVAREQFDVLLERPLPLPSDVGEAAGERTRPRTLVVARWRAPERVRANVRGVRESAGESLVGGASEQR